MLVCRLFLTFVLVMSAIPVEAADLGITVDGLRSSKGTVLVGLYDTRLGFENAIKQAAKDGFLNDPDRVAGVALRATTAMTSGIVFRNVEPGRYAIILFHDENGNGRLDVNFWGVPTEPYGFSNDAQGAFEAPSFDAASMLLDGADRSVTIHLVYHQGGLVEDMRK
jgi:uncharacterized protein (DUF2141 family)